MSFRRLYMQALRREPVPAVTWAPNFDHWYAVNSANGTIPEPYRHLAPNALVRAVGGTIWRRVGIVQAVVDDSVRVTHSADADRRVTRFATPVGELQTVHVRANDSANTWFLQEHRVKTVDDLRPLRYLYDATGYELTPDAYARQAADVGEDGIVLTCLPAVPFIELAKMEIGYQNAYYLLYDYPAEMAQTLAAMERSFLIAYRLAAEGPCEVVSNGDNMDQLTCPPELFGRYAVPFYQQVAEILHAGGKLAQGHWCGRLDQLVPLIADCGLDIIEAATPRPMTELDMSVLMDAVEGRVAVQGGVPSVYMCAEGCSREVLVAYVERLLEQIGRRRGFVLGLGDNVPTNADFDRVQLISDTVARFNAACR